MKISTPSSSSRSLICFDTPDCDVYSTFATSVRFMFWRTASRTKRSCWKFMGISPVWPKSGYLMCGKHAQGARHGRHAVADPELQRAPRFAIEFGFEHV